MVVYYTDHSKAVVPVLVLLFVALWFNLRFVLSLALCYFVLVFFSPFSIAITSLWEERANLSAFRTFVRFELLWFRLFPPWTFLLTIFITLNHDYSCNLILSKALCLNDFLQGVKIKEVLIQRARNIEAAQRTHDVYTTSYQRRCNVMTLHRH